MVFSTSAIAFWATVALSAPSAKRYRAVAVAVTTARIAPIGFEAVATLNRSIASLAPVILFAREMNAATSERIANTFCTAATAMTAAL